MGNAGPLAFIGGGEWQHGCSFDRRLIDSVGAEEVLVMPTASAYEHPERVVEAASAWFGDLGVKVQGLEVLGRRQAEDDDIANIVRSAKLIYLSDGSPLHLRSVVKDSKLWGALVDAWRNGAAIVGSSAGAMILGDPMVDPRGGAFTLGLGLVRNFAVIPHWETWSGDKARRMTHLIPAHVVVAEVEEQTALIRWSDGSWESAGAGKVTLTRDKHAIEANEIEATVEVL